MRSKQDESTGTKYIRGPWNFSLLYESESQTKVSTEIVQQRAESLTAGVTDNELAVVIEVNGHNAAFTADEARRLADGIESTSIQRWEEEAEEAVEYIRELADVVNGDKVAEEVESPWHDKELNP